MSPATTLIHVTRSRLLEPALVSLDCQRVGFPAASCAFRDRPVLLLVGAAAAAAAAAAVLVVRDGLVGTAPHRTGSEAALRTNYLVDPASSICLSQRLSHACLSTSR